MTEKLKPTPGPWLILGKHVETVNETICEVFQPMTGNINEAEDNHRLIAEARTVHHECGLSPREMMEAIRGMRSILEQSTAHIKELCMCYSNPLPEATMGRIYDALAKHKEV